MRVAALGQGGPRSGGSSELRTRVLSALVLIPVALAATWLGGLAFTLLWIAAAVAIAHEWLTMAGAAPRRPLFAIAAVTLGLAGLLPHLGAPAFVTTHIGLAGLALTAVIAAGRRDRLWALGGLAYAMVILVVPVAVRAHPALGIAGIVWIFAVVWGSDIAAYFTGRALGGPKLWPAISPKKTWSGFLGGVAAAGIAGAAVGYGVQNGGGALPVTLATLAFLSALGGALGQAGDLAESAMKRHFGAKDSGWLIPGHGGVMDRLDAFWAVAAMVGLLVGIATLAGAAGFAEGRGLAG